MKKIIQHPIFLAGFRPLFPLAMLSGMLLPLVWAMAFSGKLNWSADGLNSMAWHAHEMLFGFGWAVLGGFLLTSSKNWVKVRGIHGLPLLLLSLLWILERIFILTPSLFGGTQSVVWIIVMNLYIVGLAGYVLWTLLKYRANDFYKDNFFFYLILAIFIISKNLILIPAYYKFGIDISVGLFRLAFAVMFERTLTQFMKNTESVDLIRNSYLDYAIKGLLVLSVFYFLFPRPVGGLILGLTAMLLFIRWVLWKPLIGFKKFGNAVMYIGYLGLVLHLLFEASHQLGYTIGSATTALHTFTFLCMGVVIPGMFIRICQGHTGRKPQFLTSDKVAIYLMLLAAVFRLVLPSLFPFNYTTWITISAILWASCFLIISIRLIPFCLKPRIDGKVH